ncbi:MAG: stage II sporulation protein D [Peptococcia bacterium]
MALWRYRKRRVWRKRILIGSVLLFVAIIIVRLVSPGESNIEIREDTNKINLYDHLTGQVIELGLEEYVAGVVAAEMPASFHIEALKAQAVAARTYAVKRLQVSDPRVKALSPLADISSDHQINQAWISDEEMRTRWGKWNYAENKKKIVRAVEETWGEVSIYEGQLIDPSYHASCGGLGTENSGDVWKHQVPYLQHAKCGNHPEGNHEAVVAMKIDTLAKKLGVETKEVPASKIFGYTKALQVTEKTSVGRIKSLTFGGRNFTGSELRSKLDLKSTMITWKIENDVVKFETLGYGHAVGMCQHGANAMAQEGKDYRQILSHYYQGTTIGKLK